MSVAADPSAVPATPDPVDPLDHVDVWVFDLDNTLYPADSNLFDQVHQRMGRFIVERLGLAWDEARALQKRYFHEHGTTLRGLMTVNRVDPDDYLSFVHDIDVTPVPPSPGLDRSLARLAGRKIVFTNGSVGHATRVLDRLGVTHHFEAIEDIVSAGFVPKPNPDPYDGLVDRNGFDPARAVMVEDMAVNLGPAHALGMTTVWVRTPHTFSHPPHPAPHVHHRIDKVEPWLDAVVAAREGRTTR